MKILIALITIVSLTACATNTPNCCGSFRIKVPEKYGDKWYFRLSDAERYNYLTMEKKYSPALATAIMGQKWKEGWTQEMVSLSIGYPFDVNRTVVDGVAYDQWVYQNVGLFLYFDDGILTSYQSSRPF